MKRRCGVIGGSAGQVPSAGFHDEILQEGLELIFGYKIFVKLQQDMVLLFFQAVVFSGESVTERILKDLIIAFALIPVEDDRETRGCLYGSFLC